MSILKRTLALLLVVASLFALGTVSTGALTVEEQIQAANVAIAEINKKKAELEAQLAEIEDEVEAAQYKANTYAQRRALVEEELELTNTKIELKQTELSEKQMLIDETQRNYDETYALFKERLVSMYKNNTASSLSVLLGCDTFSEFLVTADNISSIAQRDTDMMDQLIQQKQELEEAKAAISEELEQLEQDKQEREELYSQLAALYQEANGELTEVQAEQAAKQEDYDELLRLREEQEKIIDALMAENSDIDYVGGYYAWPVPGYSWISSPYGWRTLFGQPNFHGGMDIAGSNAAGVGIRGQNAIASNTGQVTTAYYGTTGYGHYVIIDHGGGYKTLYGHLDAIYVQVGDWVAQGTPIGAVGSTGNSTGPHLHFEIRINGEKIDPETMVSYGT